MDDLPAPAATFAPDRRLTILASVGAAISVVAAIVVHDAPGRVLAAVAAVVLVTYALGDIIFRPRLTVSATEVSVRTPATRVTLSWDDIEDVRADVRARLGLRSTALEIDAGPTLIVLSRRALGADPEQAADLVRAFRPS